MNTGRLTQQQICGQRIMAGFNGTEMNPELEYLISEIKAGGIILFSRNIESPEQVKTLCREAQKKAAESGQPPLFIAVDQEGGVVARLKEPFTLFPEGNPGMASVDDADRFAQITSDELKEVGFNMDMAPVMDVEPDGFTGIMERRVFKGDADRVAEMGGRIISGLQANGIMAVAKHFPGIGRTTLDSHLTLPVLDMDEETFRQTDLVPFQASVEKEVAGMMLSHIRYDFLDPDWPASLSEKIVRELLRAEMGYDGVVMTDDLDMKAITVDIETSVNRIIRADVDIALICHQSDDIETAYRCFLKDYSHSTDAAEACEKSVSRILNLKKQYLNFNL